MMSTSELDYSSENLDVINLIFGKSSVPMPDWASWLVWLGEWMKVQTRGDGRRIAIVRLPNRSTAAAFTVFGVLLASARMHNDELDWGALKSLPLGTKVFWREKITSKEGKSRAKSGKVLGLQIYGTQEMIVVSVDSKTNDGQANHSFSKKSALNYGITLGAITAKADAQLLGLSRIVSSLFDGFKASWLRTPAPECLVLSERDSFIADLEGLTINIRDGASESFGTMLSLTDAIGHMHGKTRLVSPRLSLVPDAGYDIVILDGSAALQRMLDTSAKSVIAILDRTEYDEEVEQLVTRFMGYRRDEFIQVPVNGVRLPPEQIDLVVFGLPKSQSNMPIFEA
jgi:hypothetical protein